MSVEIKGLEELLQAIAESYTDPKAKQIRKQAINAGGDRVVEQLKKNFDAFKDSGYSKDEIMRTDARTKENVEGLEIGWNGPHGRWRLIHLNEFGYTRKGKQYTPKGFGTIQKTIEQTKEDYLKTVYDEMRKNL